MEVGFRERADAVATLLRATDTEFVLVTSPQHDALVEAAWFVDQLDERGYGVTTTIVNRVHPRFGDGSVADARRRAETAAETERSDLAATWANLADLRAVADAERAEVDALLGHTGAPVVEVPLLPTDVHDLDSLRHLGRYLFAAR
jgi:anion-transporting  ArsA/GET3 family ATPase